MNRSCGHEWGTHPYLFDHELVDSDPQTLAMEEKLHPCDQCLASDLLVIQKQLSESDDVPF